MELLTINGQSVAGMEFRYVPPLRAQGPPWPPWPSCIVACSQPLRLLSVVTLQGGRATGQGPAARACVSKSAVTL